MIMTDISARTILEQQRRRFALSLEDCWAAYFALGGHRDLAAISAFLDGDLVLPQTEVDILAAAVADLAPGAQPALWSTATPPDGLAVATDSSAPKSSDGIIQLIAEQLGKEISDDNARLGAPREPVKLTDVEMLIRSGLTTSVRAALPTSAGSDLTDLLGPMSPGGSLLRVESAPTLDWEIHASGDELLILLVGEARIEIDRSISTTATLRDPYEAYVIPRGRWHRHLAANADTKVIFLTPTEASN
jgi:hypothetical protein